jgi:hypothetical protein
MPVAAQLEGALFVVRCVGEYGVDELLSCVDRSLAAPGFPEHAHALLDVREAQSLLSRSVSDLRRVAFHFLHHRERFGNRGALVVEGLARYGLMRMASTWVHLRGIDMRVFRNEPEARAWLLGDTPDAGD